MTSDDFIAWAAEAVEAAGLACEVFADGMVVQVDAATAYEPDATLRCGAPLPDDVISAADPLIVVEVLSPSGRAGDSGAKLADYFRLPSLRHTLIVATERRTIRLDPPGIEFREIFG